MLRTTGSLQRFTYTKGTSGGQVLTVVPVADATDIACDIQPASGNIQEHYRQLQLRVTHSIYLASDIGAKATDRFVSGTRTFVLHGARPPAPGYSEWPMILDVEEKIGSA